MPLGMVVQSVCPPTGTERSHTMKEFLDDLEAEELDPRLELQVLIDPLSALADAATGVNCRDGGKCNVKEA